MVHSGLVWTSAETLSSKTKSKYLERPNSLIKWLNKRLLIKLASNNMHQNLTMQGE